MRKTSNQLTATK